MKPSPLLRWWGTCLLLAALLAFTGTAAATSYKQPGFTESVVFSGLINPTTVRFLPDGSVLVAEKSGLIKKFDSLTDTTPTIVADLRTQVHNFWDRGLLGLAVPPGFDPASPDPWRRYVYVLYSHDALIGGPVPKWGTPGATSDPCPGPADMPPGPGPTTDGCVISGHLSRLLATGPDWAANEQVLIEDWCQQFPSHSTGALAFGADEKLYLSAGDGGSFNNQDWGQFGGTVGTPPFTPKNPCGDPPVPGGGDQSKPTAEGGALRSQSPRRSAGEPRVLNGSILRVEPDTGAASPGNPLFGSVDANERRIIGFGLRNPFRTIVKPGTNDVWIADVGWGTWEEINRIPDLTSARNFGWPCFEGNAPQYTGLNICPAQAQTTAPVYTYNHGASVVSGDGCATGSSSVAGMAFYGGASNYPSNYTGALFFSDYSRKCVWVMFPGGGGDPDPNNRAAFAANANGPVDLQIGPDGDLYYVDFDGGRILKVKYGLSAIAVATSPTSGDAPLTVIFDGTGTIPAQVGDSLTYAWDLDGDGQYDDSAAPQPSFDYTLPGIYTVRLKITDQRGASDISDPIIVSVGNAAPTATILTPAASLTWKVNDIISFSGQATDPQEGDLPPSQLSWSIIIHHCPSTCHTHALQSFTGVASGTFSAPDHAYPSYLEIQLTATDSGGLTNTASIDIQPLTVSLSFQTSPSGLTLTVGTDTLTAPINKTVIVGSLNSIEALSSQGTYPTLWEFTSWSDGGARIHNITAPQTTATYTATYATLADLSITMSAPGGVCDGMPITYLLNVANAGLSRANAVSVLDTLPTDAVLVSAGGAGWTCSGTAVVSCTRPFLDVGAASLIEIVVTPAAGSSSADNLAAVGSTTTDVVGSNNSASASTIIGVLSAPTISVANSVAVGATGLNASVPLHSGSSYAWTLTGGTITGGQGSAQVTFDAGSPGTTMRLAVTETRASCVSPISAAKVQVDFLDVPPQHQFHDFVATIARNAITVGCHDGTVYCPDDPSTRAQMAVFLLKSKFGAGHVPLPAVGGVFADVHPGDFAADWIEELASLGITGGCGNGDYCPDQAVTRGEMAVFLLKAHLGSDYAPQPATHIFEDVPADHFAIDWIEDLYNRLITAGCQADPLHYCPDDPNTRGQMAVFLTKTFTLQ